MANEWISCFRNKITRRLKMLKLVQSQYFESYQLNEEMRTSEPADLPKNVAAPSSRMAKVPKASIYSSLSPSSSSSRSFSSPPGPVIEAECNSMEDLIFRRSR